MNKFFSKPFFNKDITVEIDNELYYNKKDFFDILFYHWHSIDCYNHHVFFIFGEIISGIKITDSEWEFLLINELENYIMETVGSLVLHASCIIHNQIALIICGKRKSGKSLLTNHLCNEKGDLFVDDDCVLISQKSIDGTNFPQRLRDYVKDSIIIKDDEGNNRYLKNLPKVPFDSQTTQIIIFIEYNKDENEFKHLNKRELFDMLLINCRYSRNNSQKYSNVMELVNNVDSFLVKYTSFEYFDEVVKNIYGE